MGKADPARAADLDAQTADEFAQMGVEVERDAAEADQSDGIEVLPEAWDVLNAFLSLETQWTFMGGFGGAEHIGLVYGSVEIILTRLKLPDAAFFDILEMERAALEAMREAK